MDPPRKNFLMWLDDSKLDAPVYRFMPFHRLEDICKSKKNCLVRPKLWDDPFENFLFSADAVEADGRHVDLAYRNDFYGQCWTDADETDAMWRIYSHDKDGVRVRCTPRKLLTGLYASEDSKFCEICYFIGKVTYHPTEELTALLENREYVRRAVWSGDGAKQCETLLLKRTAFAHESEVRLLHQLRRTDAAADDLFFYPLDPVSMFDELVLDPRLEKSAADSRKTRLTNLGFTCQIRQSVLYQLPNLCFRLR